MKILDGTVIDLALRFAIVTVSELLMSKMFAIVMFDSLVSTRLAHHSALLVQLLTDTTATSAADLQRHGLRTDIQQMTTTGPQQVLGALQGGVPERRMTSQDKTFVCLQGKFRQPYQHADVALPPLHSLTPRIGLVDGVAIKSLPSALCGIDMSSVTATVIHRVTG